MQAGQWCSSHVVPVSLFALGALQVQSSTVAAWALTDCGQKGAFARSVSGRSRCRPGARARQSDADEVQER